MKPTPRVVRLLVSLTCLLLLLLPRDVSAEEPGSAFTYQGQLRDANGVAITETCDFSFDLYDSITDGSQISTTQSKESVGVVDGLFAVSLDFGSSAFDGGGRWLRISVRCPAGSGNFTALSPRRAIQSTPYAVMAGRAASVAWANINGVPTDLADGDDDSRLTDASLVGSTLILTATGGSFQISLSALQDGTGSDDQNLSLSNNSLTIEDGNSVDLAVYLDNTDAQTLTLSGPNLSISGGNSVDLSVLQAGDAWLLEGNSGTSYGTDFLGTTDSVSVTVRVSDTVAMRFAPGFADGTPNLIGGSSANTISDAVQGSIIAGGGSSEYPIQITADFGTVGGGSSNSVTALGGTIGGGGGNSVGGFYATAAGGALHNASGDFTAIGGGETNSASGSTATISGGSTNTASGNTATIGGGSSNIASGNYATIPGGLYNRAGGDYSYAAGRRAKADDPGAFVWADSTNTDFYSGGPDQFAVRASGGYSLTGGAISINNAYTLPTSAGSTGQVLALDASNTLAWTTGSSGWGLAGNGGTTYDTDFLGTTDSVSVTVKVNNTTVLRLTPGASNGIPNLIGGGAGNDIPDSVDGAVIGGGGSSGFGWNSATANFAAVSGGAGNKATGWFAAIGGGNGNTASSQYDTVGGGWLNSASGFLSTVGGGDRNSASSGNSTVAGGARNVASNNDATVGGGWNNIASGWAATVAGGLYNTASGKQSTVSGGTYALASGDYSYAAGRKAKATSNGAFVWADSTDADFYSGGPDQFAVRASGGYSLTTNSTGSNGCFLSPGGGSWSCTSNRDAKENFADVDPLAVLEALAGLPISQWNYIGQDAGIRHIGPMAQDFAAAFGLGENDITISSVDADGISLAAIQGLYLQNQAQANTIAAQQQTIEAQQTLLAELLLRVAALEAANE